MMVNEVSELVLEAGEEMTVFTIPCEEELHIGEMRNINLYTLYFP